MPRPYQPIKRLKSNSDVWYVQIRDTAGKRHSLSLETTDKETAMRRYGQAMKLLQERIRATEAGAKGKWTDEQIEDMRWQIDATEMDAQALAGRITGKGQQDEETGAYLDKSTQELAERLHGIKPALTWEELIPKAESRYLQQSGKAYSPSWYEAIGLAIGDCPFSPEEATPENIGLWIQAMQSRGLAPKTIQLRCSGLSGLINSGIKTGWRTDLVNGFGMVDYTTKKVKHHVTATDEDMSLIKGLAPTLPKPQELAILVELFTGIRSHEIKDRKPEDIEVDAEGIGWLTIGNAKTDAGIRTTPIPPELTQELIKHWPKKFPHNGTLNKRLKAGVRSVITNHSMRHGAKRLHRVAGLDSVLSEALLGHELGSANRQVLESVYGGDYPREQLLEGARKIWTLIEQLPTTTKETQ